jgi:hypothetical protein
MTMRPESLRGLASRSAENHPTRGHPHDAGRLPTLNEVAVLALAASRIARAASLDEVSKPLRDKLSERAAGGGRVWDWMRRLLSCPVCTGWWASVAVSVVAPGRHRLLRGVAVSGAQVMLTLLERLVSEEGRTAIHRADVAETAAERRSTEDDPTDRAVRLAGRGTGYTVAVRAEPKEEPWGR